MKPEDIESFLNSVLHPEEFDDYCFNGIQIEGSKEINKVVTGGILQTFRVSKEKG